MKRTRWEILYEDDYLIVVNKPARFLTIPDRYDKTIPSLIGTLSLKRDKVFVNHRLDKETSGLILFTKTEEAHKALSLDFENRELEKHYKAIVHGLPAEEIGLINLPVAPKRGKGMIVSDDGKEALTKYRLLESFNRFSLLEVKLLTGRQHQIRLHMKAIGCQIVCDKLYGDGEPFYLSSIKRRMHLKSDEEERPLLSRVGLHASELKFSHPISRAKIEFEAPLPKDMKALVHQLSKLNNQ